MTKQVTYTNTINETYASAIRNLLTNLINDTRNYTFIIINWYNLIIAAYIPRVINAVSTAGLFNTIFKAFTIFNDSGATVAITVSGMHHEYPTNTTTLYSFAVKNDKTISTFYDYTNQTLPQRNNFMISYTVVR